MLRLLADENFNGDIVRGLLLRMQDLDIVRIQDTDLLNQDDPSILEWSAENNRIVLTHDRASMPSHAYDRMAAGAAMAGVFVLSDRFPVGQAIQEILLIVACSQQKEWNGRVVYLPL